MCFSKVPAGPRAPGPADAFDVDVAAVPGIDDDGVDGRRFRPERRASARGPVAPGVAGLAWAAAWPASALAGRRCAGVSAARSSTVVRRVGRVRAFDDAEGAVARALIDGDRRRVGQRAQRQHEIRRRRPPPARGRARSRRSARSSRPGSATTVCGVDGVTSKWTRAIRGCVSSRTWTRGTRTSPTTIRCVTGRTSRRGW